MMLMMMIKQQEITFFFHAYLFFCSCLLIFSALFSFFFFHILFFFFHLLFFSLGGGVAGNYRDGYSHKLASLDGYTGADAIGISLASTVRTQVFDSTVCDVASDNGNAVGMRALFESHRARGNITFSGIVTHANAADFGPDAPQYPPTAMEFYEDKTATRMKFDSAVVGSCPM